MTWLLFEAPDERSLTVKFQSEPTVYMRVETAQPIEVSYACLRMRIRRNPSAWAVFSEEGLGYAHAT